MACQNCPLTGSDLLLQVNSIWPVIQPARNVDFIIVADNSGTELSVRTSLRTPVDLLKLCHLQSGWMNGTNFINTGIAAAQAGIRFPKLPSVQTMLNKNYTSRPTFFGCNDTPGTPLVLYVADYPYSAYTNISFQAQGLSTRQVSLIQQNALVALTQNNNGLRANWSSCLGCASVYRSLQRMNTTIPSTCQQCMKDYCWQGDVDNSSPSFLQPSLALNSTLSYSQWNSSVFYA